MRELGAAAVMILLVVGGTVSCAYAEENGDAIPAAIRVRALAENVLGEGLIRGLSLTGGETVLIRWEAATYRSGDAVERARDQLFGESELVTGSILGGLRRIARIKFVMVRRDGLVLAQGENTRGPGVSMRFSSLLGGGTRTAPAANAPATTGGGAGVAKD